MTTLLFSLRHHCPGSIRQFPDPLSVLAHFSIVQLIQTAALVRGLPYDTDRPLLTRSTYICSCGLCASPPVYKHPVFRQSSPKVDLVSNTTACQSSQVPPLFPLCYISHSESSLAILETSTPSSTCHQFTLSTSRTIKARCSLNISQAFLQDTPAWQVDNHHRQPHTPTPIPLPHMLVPVVPQSTTL